MRDEKMSWKRGPLRIHPDDRESLRIHPGESSRSLEEELRSRIDDVIRFRTTTLRAVDSPLLARILVQKTRTHLDNFPHLYVKGKSGKDSMLDKLRYRVRILQIICRMVMLFRKYERSVLTERKHETHINHEEQKNRKTSAHIRKQDRDPVRTNLKLPIDVRECLSEGPRERSSQEKIKIRDLLRKYQLHLHFPKDKEHLLWNVVVYEHYDPGRVVFTQNQPSKRFYYLYSGTATRITTTNVVEGFSTKRYEDVGAGTVLDMQEVVEGSRRSFTLVSKTPIEVLIIERNDVLPLFEFNVSTVKKMMERITLFSTYPFDTLLSQTDQLKSKYFIKGAEVVRNIQHSEYIYLIQSGSCTCMRRTATTRPSSVPTIPKQYRRHRTGFRSARPATSKHKNERLVNVLEQGSLYGLHTMLPQITNVVQLRTNQKSSSSKGMDVEGRCDEVVVSDGAQCILIPKHLFIKHADLCTLAKIIVTPVASLACC